MALTREGLTVESYTEVLRKVNLQQQQDISPSIEIGNDTLLGQFNQIFSESVSSVNELLQDIYDQRNINVAEGKALDDAISWLGIRRQGASATRGEQYFVGVDGTIISQGSFLQNDLTLDNYTTDTVLRLSKDSCRACRVSVLLVDDQFYNYEISVKGIASVYQSQVGDTKSQILAQLNNKINTDTDGSYLSFIEGDEIVIEVTNDVSVSVSLDLNLKIGDVTSAGFITGVEVGSLPAVANSVLTILSPTNGLKSTFNPNALVLGRLRETDSELRNRAVQFRSSNGKATVDSIKAALLDVSGVSSVAVNERYVSDFSDDVTCEVTTVSNNSNYSIKVNNETYTVTSSGSATPNSIANQIVTAINSVPQRLNYFSVNEGGGVYSIKTDNLYKINVEDLVGNQTIVDGQPSGSIQCVVAGGSGTVDGNNEIAQTIWDTKPAGVEVWAVNGITFRDGIAIDATGNLQLVEFNRPESIEIGIVITYKVFDERVYPENEQDAENAIALAVQDFGNSLSAGEAVFPNEFEGSIYGAVNGIYNVKVIMTAGGQRAESTDPTTPDESIDIASDQESFFTVTNIDVINQT